MEICNFTFVDFMYKLLQNVGKLKEMVESTMEFYNDFRISEGKKV